MTRSEALAFEAPTPESSWLVEDAAGRLVAHRLVDLDRIPAAVKTAVLSGELVHLDHAATRRRTLGLVRSGPVLRIVVDERDLVRVPLQDGALWLVVDEIPSLADLEAAGAQAQWMLREHPSRAPLLWCLDGHPDATLPPSLASRPRLWVLAVLGGDDEVVVGLREAGFAVERCTRELTSYVVVGGGPRATTAHVLLHVRRAIADGRAGMSAQSTDLTLARAQAELALRTTGRGELLSTEHDRSTIVVRHLAELLAALPALGPDPLERLAAPRHASLVQTLRCWLDTGRDLAATTAALAIHPNTLRYRLQRIEQVLGVDLRRDAATVLELHLRLQAQPQLSRMMSSTGS